MADRLFCVEAIFNEQIGIAARLFCDIERFGWEVVAFSFARLPEGCSLVEFAVRGVPLVIERAEIRHRFERYPTALSVRVVESAAHEFRGGEASLLPDARNLNDALANGSTAAPCCS